jgi:hypothetical protein
MKYGFSLGLNHSNLQFTQPLTSTGTISNGLGFRLGALVDFKILDFLHILPKTELSFNASKIRFSNTSDLQTDYDVMPMSLEIMTHFVFKKKNTKLSPYLFFGPNIRLSITEKAENTTTYPTGSDFVIDFGVGLEKTFSRFNLSPELRYSYGWSNISRNPVIPGLQFHNLSLVFSFTK